MLIIACGALLLLLNLVCRDSKPLFIATLVFLWIVMAFSSGLADETVYIGRYLQPELYVDQTEYGYALLQDVFRVLGFGYAQFKAAVQAIELCLVSYTILKCSNKPNVVLSLYMICPFAMDAVQIRNALASAIVIFSFHWLLAESRDAERPRRERALSGYEVKYIIGVVAASFVHTAMFFFLLVVLARRVSTRRCWGIFCLVSIALALLLSTGILSSVAQWFGAGTRMSAYLSDEYRASDWRHLRPALVIAVNFTCMVLCYRLARGMSAGHASRQVLEFGMRSNIVLLVTFVFAILVTGEVYRIQFAMLVVNYVILANTLPPLKSHSTRPASRVSRSGWILLACLLGSALVSISLVAGGANTQSVLIPLLFNNTLLP